MATTTTYKSRTREEIIAWWQEARERKEAFQRKVDEEWEARQRTNPQLEEIISRFDEEIAMFNEYKP